MDTEGNSQEGTTGDLEGGGLRGGGGLTEVEKITVLDWIIPSLLWVEKIIPSSSCSPCIVFFLYTLSRLV